MSPLIPSVEELLLTLRNLGASEATSTSLVPIVKSHLRSTLGNLGNFATVETAHSLAGSACALAFAVATEFEGPKVSSVSAWEIERRVKLPPKAVTFADGGQPGESVLDYFNRFWGPYRDAGILYQDDIARLGDRNLVKTVRTFCSNHNIEASAVLPPPAGQRGKDELAAIDQSSPRAVALRRNEGSRKRQQRRRGNQPRI